MNQFDFSSKLTTGVIVQSSISLYRSNAKYFLTTALFFLIPVLLISYSTFEYMMTFQEKLQAISEGKFDAELFKLIGKVFLISLINSAVMLFYKMVVVTSTASLINGIMPSLQTELLYVFKKGLVILVTYLLMIMMILFGMILFIIPGFIVMGMLLFVPQILMLEKCYFFTSFDRSFYIIKHNFLASIMIPLIFYFVYMFVSSLSDSIIGFIAYGPDLINMLKDKEALKQPVLQLDRSAQLIQTFVSYTLFILISPLIDIGVTLKFFNLRTLKDGVNVTA